MDMPPTRYRVVEEGRRLVVIDRWTGEPVRHAMREPAAPAGTGGRRPKSVEQARAGLRTHSSSGASMSGADWILTTQAWFDDHAPRGVRIPPGHQAGLTVGLVVAAVVLLFAIVLIGWLLVPIGLFLVLQPASRKGLRAAITTLLDGLDEEEAR